MHPWCAAGNAAATFCGGVGMVWTHHMGGGGACRMVQSMWCGLNRGHVCVIVCVSLCVSMCCAARVAYWAPWCTAPCHSHAPPHSSKWSSHTPVPHVMPRLLLKGADVCWHCCHLALCLHGCVGQLALNTSLRRWGFIESAPVSCRGPDSCVHISPHPLPTAK